MISIMVVAAYIKIRVGDQIKPGCERVTGYLGTSNVACMLMAE